MSLPMMDAIKTLNGYGLEVTSGIILGLDTDTRRHRKRLKDFIDLSQIPMLTINLLQALPQDAAVGSAGKRDGPARRRSVTRKQRACSCGPTTRWWRRGGARIAYAYDPENLFERFAHQVDATYAQPDQAAGQGAS